ncbi:MAG: family 78 glycoside hydrolase catalytic domain [Oscillospiraceae bacterium]|jgi:alpha-L-rhamnosidase|nr:family 78 glycoside hydrolase catalytic domain [Oscillospiraceae bacterium]
MKSLRKKKISSTLSLLLAFALLLGFIPATAQAEPNAGSTAIGNLKVNFQTQPLCVSLDDVRFSWNMSSNIIGMAQNAYQIKVYKGQNAAGTPVWDSGVRVSDISTGIRYEGPALSKETRYTWTVSVTSIDDAVHTAQSYFETDCDFTTAGWIIPANQPDSTDIRVSRSALVRTEQTLSGSAAHVADAKLYISALGIYTPFIDGRKVLLDYDGEKIEDIFNPGLTDYRDYVNYQAFDITDYLTNDSFAFGVMLGKGWYAGRHTESNAANSNNFRNVIGPEDVASLAMIAKIIITYDDGTPPDIFNTSDDGDWKSSVNTPFTANEFYDGEDYDANIAKAIDGWNELHYDDEAWDDVDEGFYIGALRPSTQAIARFAPEYTRYPVSAFIYDDSETVLPPDSPYDKGHVVKHVVNPSAPISLAAGKKLIVDLGQNMVGVAEITVSGPQNATVTLRHGEMLNDGMYNPAAPGTTNPSQNGGSDGPRDSLYTTALRTAKATDRYTLSDDAVQTYRPLWTFHGFQYMEITADQDVIIGDVKGMVITSVGERTGWLETSSADVNQLISNVLWSQMGNFLTVPTDCPQRDERMAWTGDIQVFAQTGVYNFNVIPFMENYIDILNTSAARHDNSYGATAPVVSGGASFQASGWIDAGIVVPYVLYKQTGDTALLEKHFAQMEDFMRFVGMTGTNNNYSGNIWGDHLAAARTSTQCMDRIFHYYTTQLMAEMADILGRPEDKAKYMARLPLLKEAFVNIYVDDEGNLLCGTVDGPQTLFGFMQLWDNVDNPQTGLIWALKLGLYNTEKQREGMIANLREAIRNEDRSITPDCAENTTTVGFNGVSKILPVLTDIGAADVAYTLLLQDENPSWLYEIRNGATTIWERWDSYTVENSFAGDGMNSFNHYSFGAVLEWMYEYMSGMQAAVPGFKKITLQPTVDTDGLITWVNGSYDSLYGTIESNWAAKDGKLSAYSCAVPANSTATLYLPVDSVGNLQTVTGAVFAGMTDNNGRAAAKFEVISGGYDFTVTENGVVVSYADGYAEDDSVNFPRLYPASKLEKLTDAQIKTKVDALIKTMTTAEKFSLLTGGSSARAQADKRYGTGYLNGIPRLGVPVLRMWDGPKGVISNSDLETSAPSSELALASSFSKDLAFKYGVLTGSDNKATAGNVQLGIQLDNVRAPFFSRSRDSLGEDPFLTGTLGTSLSAGIESQNVMSTLKHMAAYSEMFHHPLLGMFGMPQAPDQDDMIIDEQTLHEIYLSPYESIVKAKASSAIMTSFNMINGVPVANDPYIQNDVLRSMWGFTGFTMTDWGSSVDAGSALIKNGGDLEMGMNMYHTAAALQALIDEGALTMDDIDTAVSHVLTAIGQIGYLGLVEVLPDGTAAVDATPPVSIELAALTGADRQPLLEANDEITLESALKGAVLLKNDDNALPIQPGDKTAVIGLTGMYTLTGHYSEASFGWLQSMTSPYENLVDALGSNRVDGFVGLDIVGSKIDDNLLSTDAAGLTPGVELVVSEGAATVKSAAIQNVELTTGTIGGKINRTYKNAVDGIALEQGQAATLKTWFTPDATGDYELFMQGIGGTINAKINDGTADIAIPFQGAGSLGVQDANTAWPTGNLVCTAEGMNISLASRTVHLTAGTPYEITVNATATSASKDLQLRLVAFKPGERDAKRTAAVTAAAGDYDKVVVFVHDLGNGTKPDGVMLQAQRGTLALAADQLSFLHDVIASANSAGNKVIVVTNLGLPISMDWIDDIDAVLNMWLPGQQGGLATAQLLTGAANPSGKLPVTFPAGDDDTQFGPIANSYTDQRTVNTFSEGIYSGYRWYDKENITPLFDFGHGLSYTTFTYSGLNVTKTAGTDYGLDVTFTVRNTGTVTGSEVAQVYLGKAAVPADIQMAERQLAGFVRIEDLTPGEARTVTVKIDREALSYWDPSAALVTRADGTKDKRVVALGTRAVEVGAASDDIRLTNQVTISEPGTGGGSKTPGTGIGATPPSGPATPPGDDGLSNRFPDAAEISDWARPYIKELVDIGILAGRTNGTLDPKGIITRAEFTKMAVLGLNIKAGETPKAFTDVKEGDWFKEFIDTASSAGVVQGVSETAFAPDRRITRQDLCTVVHRALQALEIPTPDAPTGSIPFTDEAQIAAYALDAVRSLKEIGIISGRAHGQFDPRTYATREETAKILSGVIAYVKNA